MSKTIVEKILARASGKKEVFPGEVVWVQPDLAAQYEFRGTLETFQTLKSLGVEKVKNPQKLLLFIDHFLPPQTREEEETHRKARAWAQEQGVTVYENQGIGHQIVLEKGLIRPGMVYTHQDAHVCGSGAFGALVVGIGQDMLMVYALGEVWMIVPPTVKINVTGTFSPGVMSRDLVQHIFTQIGSHGAYRVLEFTGPAIEAMSIDERITLCNTVVLPSGAKTAIINPDEKTLDYVRGRTQEPFEAVTSDPDAEYEKVFEFDVSNLEPQVAAPSDMRSTKRLAEVEGIRIDQAYIGSCASGRMSDLRAAARILQGRKIHPEVRMNIVPSSPEVMLMATREGLMDTFIQAGAFISSPTCDFCWGHIQCLADGEAAMSTGSRNWVGRWGSLHADIYLANPASVAAAAVEGKITDPRKFL